MRKFVLFMSFVMFLVLVFPTATEGSEVKKPDSNDGTLMSSDGLLLPMEEKFINSLTLDKIDRALNKMGFTDEDTKIMPIDLKKEFLKHGGKKVDLKLEESYIKKSDMESNKDLYEPTDIVYEDDKLVVQAYATYIGSTATEYKYLYTALYDWYALPLQRHSDTLAIAWQNHSSAVNGTYEAYYQVGSSWLNSPKSVDISSLYGTKMDFWLQATSRQYGLLIEEMRIPKTELGNTGQFAISYIHPYTAISPSISIGPVSISVGSFIGDEYNYRYSYTIGY